MRRLSPQGLTALSPGLTAVLLGLTAAAAVHAQQPFTLQQVLSAPYALALTAAPVGEQFAWIENAEGVRNIWLASPTTPARQLTHYTQDDGQDIAGLAWAPDASALAYTYGAESGAAGRPANPAHLQRDTALHIFLQPLAVGAAARDIGEGHAPLFARDGRTLYCVRAGKIFAASLAAPAAPQQLVFDRGSASHLTLSPDGHQLAFVSAREHHRFIALYTFAFSDLRILAPSTGNDSAPAFSPDGRQIAFLREPSASAPEFAANRISPNPWSIVLANTSDAASRILFTAEAQKPGSVLPHLSTGEPQLYFTAPHRLIFLSEPGGTLALYSLDPSTSAPPERLTRSLNGEVEDVFYDAPGSRLLFSSNFDGYDPRDKDRRHILSYHLAGPGGEERGPERGTSGAGIETHPVSAAQHWAALVSDAHTPMHPALMDNDRGTPKLLHPGAMPATYPSTALVTPQPVIFPSSDQLLSLHGQLFLPKNLDVKVKHPAILFFHGGPRRQMLLGYPAMDYYSNAYAFNQYLASRGYIVLSVNYRGGIGYGLNFRQCEHCGADGAAEYADALGAAAFLRSRPDVDSKRIGIWGGSYGGYFVALALARNSDIFAAGVDFHGVHEWSLEDNARADWLRGTLDEQNKIAATAHTSSPMADIDTWRSPVLLIHGDDDPDVAYAQTPLLADALRARHVPVEELIFPDEVHTFLLHRDWIAAYQAASDFFDRTLKPH